MHLLVRCLTLALLFDSSVSKPFILHVGNFGEDLQAWAEYCGCLAELDGFITNIVVINFEIDLGLRRFFQK